RTSAARGLKLRLDVLRRPRGLLSGRRNLVIDVLVQLEISHLHFERPDGLFVHLDLELRVDLGLRLFLCLRRQRSRAGEGDDEGREEASMHVGSYETGALRPVMVALTIFILNKMPCASMRC